MPTEISDVTRSCTEICAGNCSGAGHTVLSQRDGLRQESRPASKNLAPAVHRVFWRQIFGECDQNHGENEHKWTSMVVVVCCCDCPWCRNEVVLFSAECVFWSLANFSDVTRLSYEWRHYEWPWLTFSFQLLLMVLLSVCQIGGIYKGKGKAKEVDLYSAFIVVPHTQGTQVLITQYYLQDGASPDWVCGHLIAAYYSFIYPERMKGWVGLVGWPTADCLPT